MLDTTICGHITLLKAPKTLRRMMSLWTCRCPHPAASLQPCAQSLTQLALWLVEAIRKLARLVQLQSKHIPFFYTANIRYPHLGVRFWPCGKVRTNLRWSKTFQSRQISLKNSAEGIAVRMAAYKLVLIRHGESCWNQENRFCGWYDADLSETGVQEAKRGGQALKGNRPGVAFRPVPGLISLMLMQLGMCKQVVGKPRRRPLFCRILLKLLLPIDVSKTLYGFPLWNQYFRGGHILIVQKVPIT